MKSPRESYDAVIVGSGPNGLAAAITAARAGFSTLIVEQEAEPGGSVRSDTRTTPGFIHDTCSGAFPLAVASPLFRLLPLESFGLKWIHSPRPVAHPLGEEAVVLCRSLEETAARLGRDGKAYRSLLAPFVNRPEAFFREILMPPLHFPRAPLLLARFGRHALRSAETLARMQFKSEPARALLAGIAAHSGAPLSNPATAAMALVLMVAGHAYGWPIPEGGARSITSALVAYHEALGGKLLLRQRIKSLKELPRARWIFLDVTAKQLLAISGGDFHPDYGRKLERYRYGPAVFKLNWALSRPIPWKAQDCATAATVHLGETLAEIVESESETKSARPFVLLGQPSLFDPTRAPPGKHTAWAYCHVPLGTAEDFTDRIESQIERFAPGFRSCILARDAMGPRELERHNPNLIGGDISGGSATLRQLLFRPVSAWAPYSTPLKRVFLCSASTPPGPGVHGMAGFHAAQAALGAKSGQRD